MKSVYHFYIFVVLVAGSILDAHSQNPNWVAPNPNGFSFNANVIATILLDDVQSNHINDKIAILHNGVVRGLSNAVPLNNGSMLHFITIFADQPIDTFNIKVYHHTSNLVYDVYKDYVFTSYGLLGSPEYPHKYNISQGNLPEIDLQGIPLQTTMETIPFDSIDLSKYVTLDENLPITYSFAPNTQLNISFQGDYLLVSGANGFTGSTSLALTATINYNGNMIEDTETIQFNINPLLASPLWLPNVPSQGIIKGGEFNSVPMHNYENQYSGTSIIYDYIPVIEEGSVTTLPNWFITKRFKHTMTVVAKLNYTPKYQFAHPNDVLGVFVGPEVRGIAYRNPENGLYYINIGSNNTDGEPISLQFYSGAMKRYFYVDSNFSYVPYQTIGSDQGPHVIELAPIVPTVLDSAIALGIYTMPVVILDSNFIGSVTFTFIAKDPNYPQFLRDESNATFCIAADSTGLTTYFQDLDQDGYGNPLVTVLSCYLPNGYVTNGNDCDDQNPNNEIVTTSISETSGTPNDGFVCKNIISLIQVNQNAQSYLWNTGDTLSSIAVSPISSTIYTVTVTINPTCTQIISDTIWVEGKLVKNSGDDGFGTLRNIISCAIEGDTITYDLPQTTSSNLINTIIIDKSLKIEGTQTVHPTISIDFQPNSPGISILSGNTLQLQDINVALKNWTNQTTFSGNGQVKINKLVKIYNQ